MGGGEAAPAALISALLRRSRRLAPRGLPWATSLAVVGGVCAALAPASGPPLQYDRAATIDGEIWRPVTAHLVHWTPRMAIMDLGAVMILGAWIERRSRPVAIACIGGGAILLGAAIHFLLPAMQAYRGASGIASALFAAAALDLLLTSPPGRRRIVAGVALAVFAAKVSLEAATGRAFAAGPLPPGVEVAPQVHLMGAVIGVLACLTLRRSLTGPSRLRE